MRKKNMRIGPKQIAIAAGIAVLVTILMTLFSAFPPLSILYNWLYDHNLIRIWNGLIGGAVAFFTGVYFRKGS